MPNDPTRLSCPVCGYDCHAVRSACCSECGAELRSTLASPNVLVITPWHLRMLMYSTALLLLAVVIGMVFAEMCEERISRQAAHVQQNMSDLQNYRGRMVQWWNELQAGREPGSVPVAPTLSANVTNSDPMRSWLSALRRITPMVLPVGLAATAAIAILWTMEAQRRRPIATETVRLVSVLLYIYTLVLLWFAGIAILVFIRS